jgi:uncharacterized membrane protein YgcG
MRHIRQVGHGRLSSGRAFLSAALWLAFLGSAPQQVQQESPAISSSDARLDSLVTAVQSLTLAHDSLIARLDAEPDTGTVSTGLQATASEARRFGLRSLLAFVLVILAFVAVRSVTWLLDRRAERNASRRLLYKRLVPIVRVLIWAIAVVLVLRRVFGFETSTLVTAGAALGVAIGRRAGHPEEHIWRTRDHRGSSLPGGGQDRRERDLW